MRDIDGKFGITIVGKEIIIANKVSGEEIPEDEPLFLLRARDSTALSALNQYLYEAGHAKCKQEHIQGISQMIFKFLEFAGNHPERMKVPGFRPPLETKP
jgi:hypothetical protein